MGLGLEGADSGGVGVVLVGVGQEGASKLIF